MSAFDRGNFNQSDAFWRNDQNFHIYEEAFRAANPAPGGQLVWDTAGEHARYDIGLAKARALDKARKYQIEAVHETAEDVFGSAYVQSNMKRSVDGVDGAQDKAIK